MTSATLENMRSWVDLPEHARQARLDAATGGFQPATYTPRTGPAMSDPTPTPDRVTDAKRAEIRARLGRGGNGMTNPTVRPARVDTANPDNPGRVDNGEPMRPQQERLVWVLLNRELRPINAEAADAGQRWFDAQKAKMTKVECSGWIDRIRAMIARGPVVVSVDTPSPALPKVNHWARWRELAAECVKVGGRYGARFAVATDDQSSNDLAFWWISPGKHHNEGKFFLRQVIGGQGAVRVHMSVESMISIAEKIIAVGPHAAMVLYGQTIGECGHCGKKLTNQESRAVGMGPKCRRGNH